MEFELLTSKNVRALVPKNATGVYFLANKENGKFVLKYVGRSDTKLRNRLLQHAKEGKYSYFSFVLTRTIFDAFRIECREYHNAVNLDNKIHPRKPKNLDYKCPYCNLKFRRK